MNKVVHKNLKKNLNGAIQFLWWDTYECQQISCCSSALFIGYVFCVLRLRFRELRVLELATISYLGAFLMHCQGRRIWSLLTFHPISQWANPIIPDSAHLLIKVQCGSQSPGGTDPKWSAVLRLLQLKF